MNGWRRLEKGHELLTWLLTFNQLVSLRVTEQPAYDQACSSQKWTLGFTKEDLKVAFDNEIIKIMDF